MTLVTTVWMSSGPKPQKNCNAVKFQMAAVEYSSLKKRDLSSSLEPFKGLEFHWKIVTWKGKVNGQERETNRIFPVGKVIGKPVIGEVKEDTRRSRRSGGKNSSKSEKVSDVDDSSDSNEDNATKESSDTSDTTSSNGADKETAIELLLDVIDEAGEKGLKRSALATALAAKTRGSW